MQKTLQKLLYGNSYQTIKSSQSEIKLCKNTLTFNKADKNN